MVRRSDMGVALEVFYFLSVRSMTNNQGAVTTLAKP
jgi:hypothetical protein